MFSNDFLKLARIILENVPNSVLVLAGANSQSFAEEFLHDLIVREKVKLLGVMDVSVLGYCCDVFLDTFPMPTGFAAIESMAKGKPVFSLDCELLKFHSISRLKHQIFKSQEKLISTLRKAEKDQDFYNQLSTASKKFIKINFCDSKKLSDVLVKVINKPEAIINSSSGYKRNI